MWILVAVDEYQHELEAHVLDLTTGEAYRFPADLLTFYEDEVWAGFDSYGAETADLESGLYIWPRDLWG